MRKMFVSGCVVAVALWLLAGTARADHTGVESDLESYTLNDLNNTLDVSWAAYQATGDGNAWQGYVYNYYALVYGIYAIGASDPNGWYFSTVLCIYAQSFMDAAYQDTGDLNSQFAAGDLVDCEGYAWQCYIFF